MIGQTPPELLPVVQRPLLLLFGVFLQLLLLVLVPGIQKGLRDFLADDESVENWMTAASAELPSDHGRCAVDVQLLGDPIQP